MAQTVAFHPRPGKGGVRLATLPPLTLYVHIPWCLKKCPYCDFNSHEARGEVPEKAYVDAVIADLEAAIPGVWGRRVHAIFVGGGTPSLFSAEAIDRLLTAARTLLPVEVDAEITLEANPGTFEQAKFRAFREAGVNRLSVGIQSFDDERLAAIGRVHGGDEAKRAARIAVETFGRVNLDLMYALPGQDAAGALADITEALAYGPEHLSAYHLTIEPNTLFHRHPPVLPGDDASSDIEEAVEAALARSGYEHYETSAYAKPGGRARHNVNYWRFGDYLGIGAGAHSKLSFAHRVVRQVRAREPRLYMDKALAGDAVVSVDEVARRDLPFEYMLGALRLREGFSLTDFSARTGLPLSAIDPPLREALSRGWLTQNDAWVAPTERGFDFLSDLQSLFLPD